MLRHKLFLCLLGAQVANAQLERIALTAAGITAPVMAINQIYISEPWWSQRRSFRLEADNRYAAGIDKFGHALAWNLVGKTYLEWYSAIGYEPQTAAWMSFGTCALLHGITEFGYESKGPYFGADIYDALAGMGGAGFVVVKQYYPSLGLNLKWSFVPTRNPPYCRQNSLLNDYQNQTYWLSIDMPKSFLSLAVGINRSDCRPFEGHTQFWISPDLNWEKLFGDHWWTRLLNSFKLPTPKMQIAPRFTIKGISWSS